MNSFICWVGGKSRLAETIVKAFPPHRTYVEVFGGAGWVLFKKESSKCEVYNDLYGDLVNLFRVVKYFPSEFTENLRLILFSRKTYYEFLRRAQNNDWHNEIERAVVFYISLKQSFGGQVGHGWGLSKARGAKALIDHELVQAVAKRLEKVFIENRDFETILKIYDSLDTLFYLDPPYWSSEGLYHVKFKAEDHVRLRSALKRIKGKFVISYNVHPEIRKLYTGYKITTTRPIHYSMNNKRDGIRQKRELLITNF